MKGERKKEEEEENKLTETSEKKKKGQKLRLGSDHGTFSVGLIMEMPLKTEL